MTTTHPIVSAQVDVMLRAKTLEELETEIPLCTARGFLEVTVQIWRAWPYKSDYHESRNYAYVLVKGQHDDGYSIIRIGGNAADQALFLEDRNLLPGWYMLQTIKVNDHDLFYWNKVQV